MTEDGHVRMLIEHLESQLPRLRARGDATPERRRLALAAGGVAHGLTMLRGIVLLERTENHVAAEVLTRTVWECWVVTMHLVLHGEDAADDLAKADSKARRALAAAPELSHLVDDEVRRMLDLLPAERQSLNLEAIERRVRDTLRQREGAGHAELLSSYNVIYRTSSTIAAHAGIAAFERYVETSDSNALTIHPDHPRGAHPVNALVAALWLCMAAQHLFDAADISTRTLRRLGDRLQRQADKLPRPGSDAPQT